MSSTCCNRNSTVVAIDQLANLDSCNINLSEFYCSTTTYCTVTEENLIDKIREVQSEKLCRNLCRQVRYEISCQRILFFSERLSVVSSTPGSVRTMVCLSYRPRLIPASSSPPVTSPLPAASVPPDPFIATELLQQKVET